MKFIFLNISYPFLSFLSIIYGVILLSGTLEHLKSNPYILANLMVIISGFALLLSGINYYPDYKKAKKRRMEPMSRKF